MSLLQNYLKKTSTPPSQVIAYLAILDTLKEQCFPLAEALLQEIRDQRSHLKLIASENFSSLSVQLAMGNLLTDKYAEGYPFHRFYAGCDNVDFIEKKVVEELKALFRADHAYVQPHSGADANMVAYWAILLYRVQSKELMKLGKKSVDQLSPEEHEKIRELLTHQTVMGMSLQSGGHLTHGYRYNFSSKIMRSVPYDVDKKSGLLDYAVLRNQVRAEKPAILVAGYSSYPRRINFAKMREIADEVDATLMVDMAHFAGLVAGGVMKGDYDPVPFADVITSTTHKTLRGPRGAFILCKEKYREVIDKGCPTVLGGPLCHVLAAKLLWVQEIKGADFKQYAHQVVDNARALAEELLSLGVELITGGSDNHLLVAEVSASFHLTGKQAESALREARFTLNRNAIPFDQNGPWYTSGIRMGTAALTTLGMKEGEMKQIGHWIVELLKATHPVKDREGHSRDKVEVNSQVLLSIRRQVEELLCQFPLYPELIID